ncbi:unnamed protein product [Diamesa tonsa]
MSQLLKIEDDIMSITKKQKLSHRENWDPLGFPEELHSLIFQHLDGKDVIAASEISWNWYNVVGESRDCIEKIQVTLKEPGNCEMEILQNSPRNYQHLTITGPINNENLKFLDLYSSSLKSLNLTNEDTNEDQETFGPISLPLLEHLKINYISNNILKEFLTSSKKLKVLAFEKVDKGTRDNLISFINACSSTLVRLELKNKALDMIFEQEVDKVLKINLNALYLFQSNRTDSGGTIIVNYHRPTRLRTQINRHLDNFLLSQAKSLQSISLDGFWYSGTVHIAFKELPLLSEVSLCRCVDHERLKIEDYPNANIKTINFLKFIRCKRQTVWSDHKYLEICNILKEAPHLKHLHVYQIPIGIVEYAAHYFHNLIDLTYNLEQVKNINKADKHDFHTAYAKLQAERPNIYKFFQKNLKV